jgi:hypothetical protein
VVVNLWVPLGYVSCVDAMRDCWDLPLPLRYRMTGG